MSETPISPLRRRMIEDMTIRNFSADTQRNYIRAVKNLAIFLGRSPDTATPEDLRLFQLHLTENRVRPPTINATVSALRFFFNVTVDRPDVTRPLTSVAEPRKIPVVLNPDEVVRFLEAAPGPKYKAAFGAAYGAGLRVSEVAALKVSDIDSQRMMIRVEQGKGRKDRYAMLSPQLLELLRDWYRIARPQAWLFPGRDALLPLTTRQLNRACHAAAHMAEIKKRVTAHIAAQLRHPPPGAEHRHPRDPGPVGARQARHHRALRPGRHHHDPRGDQPARPARAARQGEAEAGGLTRRP